MKERPIPLNAEMVRAVLDGRKTQTRRIIRASMRTADPQFELHQQSDGSWLPMHTFNESSFDRNGCEQPISCPFGAVGDCLWVRETWSVVSHAFDDDGLMVDYVPDRPAKAVHEKPFGNGYCSGHVIYAADGDFTWGDDDGCVDGRSCWKPSIHMPRWASLITLEITGVRVERLQDISQKDAIAEGGTPYFNINWFAGLWASVYGTESWQANPWVWVIDFKRTEGQA